MSGPNIRFAPATTDISASPVLILWQARWNAVKLEEQAVSTVIYRQVSMKSRPGSPLSFYHVR